MIKENSVHHLHNSSQVSKSLYLVIKSISNNFLEVRRSPGFLDSIALINSLNSGEACLSTGYLIDSVTYI